MTTRGSGRSASPASAKKYLGKASEFLEVAREAHREGLRSPAAGNAVHAGVLAADAISAAILGKVWSGDHDGAVGHVSRAGSPGKDAAPKLNRLLAIKSRAEYDPEDPSAAKVEAAIRAAESLVDLAGKVVHRQ